LERLDINPISRKRGNDHRLLFLISVGFLILCLGCGIKGPPVPPEATIPPAVKDLEAQVVEDKVRLTWSMPKKDNALFDGVEHFRVYKYKSHSSIEVCEGCPIPFKPLLDIKLEDPYPAQMEGDSIIYHDAIEANHSYAYKVVVYHKSGGVSEDSNIVHFVTKP
jgi:hypothetical protein